MEAISGRADPAPTANHYNKTRKRLTLSNVGAGFAYPEHRYVFFRASTSLYPYNLQNIY